MVFLGHYLIPVDKEHRKRFDELVKKERERIAHDYPLSTKKQIERRLRIAHNRLVEESAFRSESLSELEV